MRRARYQFGYVTRKKRRSGDVWVFRYRARGADGGSVYKRRCLGSLKELPSKHAAEKAAEALRMEVNAGQATAVPITLGGLIERYKLDKLPDRYSTRMSYLSCLRVHVSPKWGDHTLDQIAKAPYQVEKWFGEMSLAPKSKGHVKGLMHRLFECAMKWGLFPLGRNPMELVEIKNVSKRLKQPRVLTRDEFWRLVGFLEEPYRTMVLTAQCLGLRVSEVMALQWSDFDFERLTVRVQRGVVQGHVDDVKTEYSNDDLPLDPDYAALMLDWRRSCPLSGEGWVFPNPLTQRPYWQETVAARHIKPAGVKAALGSNIGWHTFRHTYRTWLDAAEAHTPIQRELMRHASIQNTMNVSDVRQCRLRNGRSHSKVVKMALQPVLAGV